MGKVTFGGDLLGREEKMKVDTKTYNRSNHNLDWIWTSSMSPGTIVPFYNKLRLHGDKSTIKLRADIQTQPTIGPLYGSLKFEIDFFITPVRFFDPKLTLDEAGQGLKMEEIKFPQVKLTADYLQPDDTIDQINKSCVFNYFNIPGIGHLTGASPVGHRRISRKFNALKWLTYLEICKRYYWPKQEGIGAVIHNNLEPNNYGEPAEDAIAILTTYAGNPITLVYQDIPDSGYQLAVYPTTSLSITFPAPGIGDFRIKPDTIYLEWGNAFVKATELFYDYTINEASFEIEFFNLSVDYQTPYLRTLGAWYVDGEATALLQTAPIVRTFPLENIDKMRKQIMRHVDEPEPFLIDVEWAGDPLTSLTPYSWALVNLFDDETEKSLFSIQSSQEGLALNTYLSDVNNNWLDKEWIDGNGGINEITSLEVDEDGKIPISQVIMQTKLFEVMNNIVITDGSLSAWSKANYNDIAPQMIAPTYIGSLIKEIVFQEVVSNTATAEQPLGTLAGRGRFTDKNKGGFIKIGQLDELCYVTGTVHITPRLKYSQGIEWDNLLENMQQIHIPGLDQVAFGDKITDTMYYADTGVDANGVVTFKSAGKQTAWVNYTTEVDRAYGNFGEINNQMFMILDRRYEMTFDENVASIKDLTRIIDPGKYNYFFAYTKLDAQNFSVQIAIDEEKRSLMSARQIPNL